jgi:hypothetical protein
MFSQEKGDAVCARLCEGLSLRKACAAESVAPMTVLGWVDANKAFSVQYAQARARGYQLLADEILDISDDSSGDVIETENGPKANAEFVARSRLRVDSRKWMLSKMLPKVYGDKLDLNHGGEMTIYTKVERHIVKSSAPANG